MSLLRKGSKAGLRLTSEDYSSCMDQKNALIATLNTEREALASTQERHERAKDQLAKTRNRYESLLRDHQTRTDNNQERLEMTVRGVQELRAQAEQLGEELRLRMGALREAKCQAQELAGLAQQRQEDAGQARVRLQEQQGLQEVREAEQERTRLQISQVKEEVDKGRRQCSLLRTHGEQLSERTYKTQAYLRSLLREETNLNQALSKVEDENAALDASVSELDTAISVNKTEIANKEKDCQELQFHIANKELDRKKIENEIREKVKQLSAEKEKWRNISSQLEQTRGESARMDSLLQDASTDINFILAKNNQINEVNAQLKDDLAVCQRHLDNLSRVNRSLQGEIEGLHQTNLKAIAKLREPFTTRPSQQVPTGTYEKWGAASRATNFQTGDFQSWKQ